MLSLLFLWFIATNVSMVETASPIYDFTFPSTSSISTSPSQSLTASYSDPGVNSDGVHEYTFLVSDRGGRRVGEFIFTRSVDGSWSREGDRLFVNNYEGSNFIDCLVMVGRRGSLELTSLIHLLNAQGTIDERGISALGISESPANSHFYLACDNWLDSETVEVSIEGYIDTESDFGREFSHRYRFSTTDGRFRPL